MPIIQANGIKIYYELHGQGEPLVLISGLTEDHTAWENVLEKLAQSFRVLIFDNRGAGQSTSPKTSFTIGDMAKDTVALLQALDIPKAHILGHSMGGAIAQQIAIENPERVLKLIIACSAAKLSPLSMFVVKTGEKLVDAQVSYELLIENVFPWLFSSDFLADDKKVAKAFERKIKNPHPQTLEGYKNQIRACGQFDTTTQLSKIKTQTLVLTTEQDILISPRHSKMLTENINGAKLVMLPNIGHIPQLENPTLFCQEVVRFLGVSKGLKS